MNVRNHQAPGRFGGGLEPPSGPFSAVEWALLASVAACWGASFLLIRVSVTHLQPPLVAMLRLGFGAGVLGVVPAARVAVPRAAWPAISALGLVWMVGPFLLFPLAERHIDSSLAGMLNATAPLFTALIAALWTHRLPTARQGLGLVLGFAGVAVICLPSVRHAGAGVGLILIATLMYGLAFNLAGPLEQQYGALAVIWRAQLVALVVISPFGLASVTASSFASSSVLAVAVLGCVSTGFAFVAFTTLAGRVGPTRASISTYFLPAVAVALGSVFAAEHVAPAALLGTALVAAGARATSRAAPSPAARAPHRHGDARASSSQLGRRETATT